MKTCAHKLIKLMFSLCLALPGAVIAQNEAVKVPDEVSPFVTQGMIPIACEAGDLNGDGRKDYILVLSKPTKELSGYDESGDDLRPALVLIRSANNKLEVATHNDKAVYCRNCGGVFGDPFAALEVKGTRFTISNYGGSNDRWAVDYTFDYSRRDNTWELVRVEETTFVATDPAKTTKKPVYTPPTGFGLIKFADFDPDSYRNKGKR